MDSTLTARKSSKLGKAQKEVRFPENRVIFYFLHQNEKKIIQKRKAKKVAFCCLRLHFKDF